MLDHTQLKKGVKIILDGQPYEILKSMPLKKAQRRVVIQTKIKNLINGNVFDRNFHQGDIFEEAELNKFQVKFLYSHKDKFVFCEENNPSKRFDLKKEQVGDIANFLKLNQIVDGLIFDEKIINISLPVKIQLAVQETPPGIKGDTAQGGTKIAILETGAQISVPLFIEPGDLIEINTETSEYVRRIEKK
ncbi:MAG: elongation factor P [Candidatus Nealsonbacteria bacterium]|nr:elongation factor P [Candidatus Nealsonbacteria bacterium]